MRTWSLPLLCQVLRLARGALHILAAAASAAFKSRATLHLENLALRHQLGVLRRSVKRPSLTSADRLLWEWLCGVWSDWRSALVIVKPETVIGWHRKGFRLYWTWKVRHGRPGRPPIGVGRLLHRPDHPVGSRRRKTGGHSWRITSRPVSGPVRVPGSGSRPKADPAFQRNRPSDSRVDRPAAPGGLSF